MIIRPATAGDAAAVAAIWNPIIDDSAATFTNLRKTPEGLQADIAARGPAFLVAEDAGLVLGFATFFQFRSGPGYAKTLEHTVILGPAARGRGVGRALMEALMTEARGQGAHCLFAGVSGENQAGIDFHAALGFREMARLPEVGFKFGRWMDLVLMQKFL
ncbi:GNAT family N-acetyltransferase [Alloyangia pacifica]|uniref:GNAT family N-acetyltransferase n=1 Tax=Alloyangia pacifica TaxID=311180 RepID=UPI001CFCD03D|nr:GNAT family N-acetyltransferase [Alloyangia pacifica]